MSDAKPTPLDAAISRVIYVPVQQVSVTNWHAQLPAGQFYATPQDRVEDLIAQARAVLNSHAQLVEKNAELRNGRILSVGDAQIISDSISMLESSAVLLPEHEVGMRCQAHLLRNLLAALSARGTEK